MFYQSLDSRHKKALDILHGSGQWAKAHDANNTLFYGIPSTTQPSVYYMTTSTSCTCPDSVIRGIKCKYSVAVDIFETLQKEEGNR